MYEGWLSVLLQSAGFRTIAEAIAAAGAFGLDDLIHMVNVLHFRMDCALRRGSYNGIAWLRRWFGMSS